VTVKTFKIVKKKSISNKFWTFYSSKNPPQKISIAISTNDNLYNYTISTKYTF